MPEITIALDKNSVRSYDEKAGHLIVSVAHLTKANVCPYLGREIPGAEALGLEPDKVYQLFRDPVELQKAVPTANGKQMLMRHKPVNAEDPSMELTVGSTGTDATWNAPYVDNSLTVWVAEAIEAIESDKKKEISAGYNYVPVMEPGTYEGAAYDGRMTEIHFNHFAFVVDGRAGDDVVVGDELPDSLQEIQMSKKQYLSPRAAMAKGAILASLAQGERLAQDQKIDLMPALLTVTPANWNASKVKIVNALKALPVLKFKDKLAQDAAVEDVIKLLDSLDGEELGDKPDDNVARDKDTDADLDGALEKTGTGVKKTGGMDAPNQALMALLEGKLSPEDMAKVNELLTPAGDEEFEEDGVTPKKKAKDAMPKVGEADKGMVTQPAMDAAIKAATAAAVKTAISETTKRMQAIKDAEREVRPYIGEIAVAMDSAEAVYKLALDEAGIDLDGVPPVAYRALLKLVPKPGAAEQKNAPKLKLAHDSAALADLDAAYPARSKIRHLG